MSPKTSTAATPPFEARLARLEQIVGELDDEQVPLDHALALFEEGVRELKGAQAALAQAEATLKVLVEQADGSFVLDDAERRSD